MAHTKGPWNIWYKGKHNTPAIANNFADCPATDICTLEGDNQEDDAALIAAAPDLLSACKLAMEWHAGFPHGGADEFEKTTSADLYEALRAAISKAEPEP